MESPGRRTHEGGGGGETEEDLAHDGVVSFLVAFAVRDSIGSL
jgi:hypothetical protein